MAHHSDSEPDSELPETLIKIIFVGDSGVGKSCLIERMFSDHFDPALPATIGAVLALDRLVLAHADTELFLTPPNCAVLLFTPTHHRNRH
jgi:GTPase SAR1 family protein